MKKVSISLAELLDVLDSLAESGTQEVTIFERNGYPAICDSNEPESFITFAEASGEEDEDQLEFDLGNNEDEGSLH